MTAKSTSIKLSYIQVKEALFVCNEMELCFRSLSCFSAFWCSPRLILATSHNANVLSKAKHREVGLETFLFYSSTTSRLYIGLTVQLCVFSVIA